MTQVEVHANGGKNDKVSARDERTSRVYTAKLTARFYKICANIHRKIEMWHQNLHNTNRQELLKTVFHGRFDCASV